MLYLFNNLEKLQAQIAKFKAKNPAGSVHRFDNENFISKREKFEELLANNTGLFGEQNLIVLNEIGELDKDEREKLTEKLKDSATKVLWFEREEKKIAEFDFFALANALAARDRGALWLGFQQALAAGVEPETIFWRSLWWKVRAMCLRPPRAYKLTEIQTLAGELVRIWHDTKREENRHFNLELESLLLRI